MLEWTPAKEIDEVTGEHTIDPSPVSAVYQAIGSASVCWKDMRAGQFDTEQAGRVAEGLIAYLKTHPFSGTPQMIEVDGHHAIEIDGVRYTLMRY